MSFLETARGVVGGLAKLVDEALPDAGDLGEKVCDALLPASYEWIGDVVSGGINMATGNYAAALSDVGDLFSDVPFTEPDPPTAYLNASVANDLNARTLLTGAAVGRQAPFTEEAGSEPLDKAGEGRGDANSPAGSTGTSESSGVKAALAFTSMTPDEMLARVRTGDIPAEIFESQSGMLMLQQRMGDIQRMNQLMTQLMQAIHDMQMAIVRNVRA